MRLYNVLKRLGLILLGLLIVVVGGVSSITTTDNLFSGRNAAQFTNTVYPSIDGTPLVAYFARPTTTNTLGGIILIPDSTGINEESIVQADTLVDAGYAVLVVDLWRGISTTSALRAQSLVLTVPQYRIDQDLNSSLFYLQHQPGVDSRRLAAIGIGFGGRQAFLFATTHPGLAATVLVYGDSLYRELIKQPGNFGGLVNGGPVLGIFGNQDTQLTPDQTDTFQQVLQDHAVKCQIKIFPDAGYGFVDQIASSGTGRDAWQEIVTFIKVNVPVS